MHPVLLLPAAPALLLATAVASAPAQAPAPTIDRAIALSRSTVRVHFVRPVTAERPVTADDLALSMGGEDRAIRSLELAANGRSAKISATPRWPHGTAGSIQIRREAPVRVYAAPGDTRPPVLGRVRLARRTVCVIGLSRSCASSGGTIRFRVDHHRHRLVDARRPGRRDAPSLLKVGSPAGSGSVRFGSKIEGRRLRPGRYLLTVTAVDAAGNESRSFTLRLRVRR